MIPPFRSLAFIYLSLASVSALSESPTNAELGPEGSISGLDVRNVVPVSRGLLSSRVDFTIQHHGVPIMIQGDPFLLLLDSGSDDIYVYEEFCDNCGASERFLDRNRPPNPQYDSTAFGDNAHIFESYPQHGAVALGKFKVANQLFKPITDIRDGKPPAPLSGLFGLGYHKQGSARLPPFWYSIANSLKKRHNFSLQLKAPDEPSRLNYGGTFSLGLNLKSASKKNVNWAPVVSEEKWIIGLTDIGVGTVKLPHASRHALIDSGAGQISGPMAEVEMIYAQLKARGLRFTPRVYDDPSVAFFEVDCKLAALPDHVFFEINGKPYGISLKNFVYKKQGQTACFGSIVGTTTLNNFWVLGAQFLGNVEAIFDGDKDRIGFRKQAK